MSSLLPPHIPQDVQETPYQQQYPVDANGAPVQQNPFQPGAAHSHYSQQQERIYVGDQQGSTYSHYSQPNAPSISYQQQPESRTYSNEEWSSPSVPYPHSNPPSNSYQQSLQDTTTPVDPQSVAPSDHGTRQYISRQQQSMQQHTDDEYHDQPPEFNWPRQLYPQQPTYPDEFHRIVNTPHRFPHEAPQQFRGAPNHAVLPGGNTSAGLRIEDQNRYGGLSAKAAGKRKAVDSDDDDSRYGESSSGTMKRFRSNANTQQMLMAPPPVSHANFDATGGMRMPSTAAVPSSRHYFEMTGMQFNADDQFEAPGTQSHQHTRPTQNGSSTSRSQVQRGYYDQNDARPQGCQAPNAASFRYETSVSSPSVHQSSQVSSVVDQYSGRSQHSSIRVIVLQSVSLLRELLHTRCKGQPGDRWGVANGTEIVLVRVLHQERPGTLHYTGIASIGAPICTLRLVYNPYEKALVHRIAVNALLTILGNHGSTVANRYMGGTSHTQTGPHGFQQSADRFAGFSGHSLPTPARTPLQPDNGSNGFAPSTDYFSHPSGHTLPTPARTPVHPDAAVQTQNGFQPSTGYFAGPSAHSLPTSARTPAQPVPIQAPPPVPTITVEDTGTLSVDDFWSTAPVQSESPRVRIADSGEDEPGLPISLADRPTTLLPDEKPADTVGEQAKTEEETSGGTLERPCHTVITDTPWYRKHILSVYEEQPVSTTSNGFQPPTDYFSRPSGQTLPTPARTPLQPDAAFQTQNDFQQSAGYLANPSVYSLPTSARAPVQPTTIQAPPPVPVITVEDTDTTDTLSVDDAWSTAPAHAESPEVQNEDSGEDEPELPPCLASLVHCPNTLLTDEKQAHTTGGQVKIEEETGGNALERPRSTVITDMPWYKEHIASAYEEQPVASTSTTSVGDPSTTDDDGATDDKEYHRVYNEFMVNDDEEGDSDGDGDSLFGSPLRRRR
ncbi:uncharacterized protein ARMOST_15567 [Armillaria ostoyae]|uniref:Uncharacterized protein n=1 Tax=Armillaria ostoyae TaxID=47428 RepID=A0A284RTS2_ARMOS|nr:uncharacterized protein ARMOST_15567 [Armillaria ostoyae]